MGYRNSTLYTLKYVADMLGEDEDFLHECSIEMFPEDGCLSAYDSYPASELTEHIVLFTEDGGMLRQRREGCRNWSGAVSGMLRIWG